MDHEEALSRIRHLTSELSQVNALNVDAQGNLGLLLGACYALARAMILRFKDRTGTALPSDYSIELSSILACIGHGQLPQDGPWLAEFYFNSALQRLAAIYHRTLKVLTGDHRQHVPKLAQQAIQGKLLRENDLAALKDVHDEINMLKHDSDSLKKDRRVSVALAVRAAEEAGLLVKLTASKSNA